MILKLIDHKIRKAFSNAAMQYDVLTSLHKEIGRELIKKVIDTDCNETILDVGMGTGWLTGRLSFYFPESMIVGIDFAPGMIDYAKSKNESYKIVQADASLLPFKNESFDIVVSNLAYQWANDLPNAFKQCHAKLKGGGLLNVTMFGFNTFKELFEALHSTSEESKDQAFPVARLANKEQIEEAVRQAGFKNVKVDYEIIKVHFPDMMALVKWIKDIGANEMSKNIFVGKQWLMRASEYYDEHYRDRLGIYATFEVVWIAAEKE